MTCNKKRTISNRSCVNMKRERITPWLLFFENNQLSHRIKSHYTCIRFIINTIFISLKNTNRIINEIDEINEISIWLYIINISNTFLSSWWRYFTDVMYTADYPQIHVILLNWAAVEITNHLLATLSLHYLISKRPQKPLQVTYMNVDDWQILYLDLIFAHSHPTTS